MAPNAPLQRRQPHRSSTHPGRRHECRPRRDRTSRGARAPSAGGGRRASGARRTRDRPPTPPAGGEASGAVLRCAASQTTGPPSASSSEVSASARGNNSAGEAAPVIVLPPDHRRRRLTRAGHLRDVGAGALLARSAVGKPVAPRAQGVRGASRAPYPAASRHAEMVPASTRCIDPTMTSSPTSSASSSPVRV